MVQHFNVTARNENGEIYLLDAVEVAEADVANGIWFDSPDWGENNLQLVAWDDLVRIEVAPA